MRRRDYIKVIHDWTAARKRSPDARNSAVSMIFLMCVGWLCSDQALAQTSARQLSISSLKQAIVEHARFRSCFQNKLASGYCQFDHNAADAVQGLTPAILVRRLAEKLDEGTAALVYFEEPTLEVYLLDRAGLRAAESVSRTTIKTNVDGVRSRLHVESRAALKVCRGFSTETSGPEISMREAATHLLPGRIGDAISAYNRLLILQWGGVAAIPFAALELPDGRTLADVASTVVLPDVSVLLPFISGRDLTFEWRATHGYRVVVGNPTYAPYKCSLPNLPGAEDEANSVAETLRAHRLLLGRNANHDNVLREVSRVQRDGGIIYFATHGISDDENPMDESFMALADRHLTAAEIRDAAKERERRGEANPDVRPLVVMSACQSGLGKIFGGGAFGISRAWYASGAGQVIGSLWNVDDRATKVLMTGFSRELARGEEPEEALRRAMVETRREFFDPAKWASFVVFGLPGRGQRSRR